MINVIAAQSQRRTAALIVSAAGLLVSLAPFIWKNQHLSDTNIVLALALAWVALVPGFLHLMRVDNAPMPFAALVGFYYLIFFSLPVFFFDPAHWQSDQYPDGRRYGLRATHVDEMAQLLLIVGLTSLLAAYYAARRWLERLPFWLRLPRGFATGRLRLLAWILIVAYFAWAFVPIFHRLPSLGQLLQKTTPIAIGLLLICAWRREITRKERILLLLGVLPAVFGMIVSSGLTTDLILITSYLTILMYYYNIRLFFLPVIICVAFMIFLYPALASFRIASWSDHAPSLSLAKRVAMPIEIAWDRWIDKRRNVGDPLVPVVRRVSIGAVTFSDVVERTPGDVPLLRGESYRPLLTGFVPRILWPGKPEERFGQIFGHRYRYVALDDRTTSWSTPWITEAYANFGAAGMVVAMALIGGFLAFASRFLNAAEMTPTEFAVGAALLFPLAYQASNLSVMVSNLPMIVGAVWLFFWVGLRPGARPGRHFA